ncbi:MAG: leucine dehydrogenase [Firmicutes bacterium]|uniref:Leucine dehydrogenase n=1 Tax=Sulfobacillus benefaciens TaxID=453960 RepID=A0A2T2X840_9FIRM|nr:leucine dehydrogenase [Bacillota bacterium]MCL5012516.1 leucine dehydrogenase [Bacillota bacterium]PSR30649.1 MAG: leucine dehydrogenase [Sulfobacillus benefaciens]
MEIFKEMARRGHEQLIFNFDKATGLKAIIAIHNTTLGPALGGCRMLPYGSEDQAIEDALRLSEGMTYKAAAAGLDFGGGKAIIIGDPANDKSEALFRAFGRFLEAMKGRYLAGEDVGTNEEDLVQCARETSYVVGLPQDCGGSGDTGEITAIGVLAAIRAALTYLYGSASLNRRHIAIQGLGKVGYQLARHARDEGAYVTAADINPHVVGEAASELDIEPADPWTILETPCDVLSPCALGNVVNHETIDKLNCRIIAGPANNQLEDPSLGDVLQHRNILYAPDFITSAGGLIQVANERSHYQEERVRKQVNGIYELLLAIFHRAGENHRSTVSVALDMVDERMKLLDAVHRIYSSSGEK